MQKIKAEFIIGTILQKIIEFWIFIIHTYDYLYLAFDVPVNKVQFFLIK